MPPTIQLPSAQITDDQKLTVAAFNAYAKWPIILNEKDWEVGETHSRSHRIFVHDADKQPIGHINTETDALWVYKATDDIPCSRDLSKFDLYAIVRFEGNADRAFEHIVGLGFKPIGHGGLAEPLIEPASDVAETAIADTAPPKRDLWVEAFPSEIPERLRSLTDVAVAQQVRAIRSKPTLALCNPITGTDGKVIDVPSLQVSLELMQFSVSTLALQTEPSRTFFLITLRYKQAIGFYPLTAIAQEADRLKEMVSALVAPFNLKGSEDTLSRDVDGNRIRITWSESTEILPVEDTDDVANIYATELSPNLRSIRSAFFEAGNESPTIADLAAQEAK